jgi:hypothetical protein
MSEPFIANCKVCGDKVGDGQEKNAVYLCDRVLGEWCGTCFDKTPCGKSKHGEGCPTLMVCEAAPSIARSEA